MKADRTLSLSLFAAGFALVSASCAVSLGARQIEFTTIADNVCGPRCVAHIQALFGPRPEAEFIELVREVQGLDLKHGSSLDALSRKLTAGGLLTTPLKLNWLQVLDVPDSATILHVLRENGEGHFLVREQFGDTTRIWDGLNGYSETLHPGYSPTGYCLVVTKTSVSGRYTRPGASFWAISIIVLGVGCLFIFRRFLPKR